MSCPIYGHFATCRYQHALKSLLTTLTELHYRDEDEVQND